MVGMHGLDEFWRYVVNSLSFINLRSHMHYTHHTYTCSILFTHMIFFHFWFAYTSLMYSLNFDEEMECPL